MRSSLALILVLCVSACGLLPEQIDETKNWSADKLYTTAKEKLTEGSYEAVNKYPMEAKELVLDALRASYREILGGCGQRSLSFN